MPAGDRKRPLDPVQSAVRAAKVATGQVDEQPLRRIYLVVEDMAQDESEKTPN